MPTARTASAQTAKAAAVADAAPLVDATPALTTAEHEGIASALVAALTDLTVVEKGRTATIPTKAGGSYSYSYADIADVVKLTRPILASHGIAALTPLCSLGDSPACSVVLIHTSGERYDFGPFPFPHGEDARATGSMVTYHRRYALVAALGMAAGDDDDGATAAPRRAQSDARPATAPNADLAAMEADLATLAPDLQEKLRTDVVARSGLESFDDAMSREDWRRWLTEAVAFYRDRPAPQKAQDGQTGVGAPDGAGGPPAANAGGVAADLTYSPEALAQAEADVSEMSVSEVGEILVGWDGVEVTGNEARDRARLAALFAARASASG